jgi:hypothetical protein
MIYVALNIDNVSELDTIIAKGEQNEKLGDLSGSWFQCGIW